MKIENEYTEYGVILKLTGELDASTALNVDESLNDLIKEGAINIIVDCSNLEYISSAGIGVFIAYLEEISSKNGEKFFYIPGCAAMTPELSDRIRGSDLVFFDGTLWRDDEMIQDNVGVKTGKRMGHMSMSGDDGSIAALGGLEIGRKIFIHINTTNPVLLEDSSERALATEEGWEISFDGMEIRL